MLSNIKLYCQLPPLRLKERLYSLASRPSDQTDSHRVILGDKADGAVVSRLTDGDSDVDTARQGRDLSLVEGAARVSLVQARGTMILTYLFRGSENGVMAVTPSFSTASL
jgi:hypothetical protein